MPKAKITFRGTRVVYPPTSNYIEQMAGPRELDTGYCEHGLHPTIETENVGDVDDDSYPMFGLMLYKFTFNDGRYTMLPKDHFEMLGNNAKEDINE